MTRTKTAAQHSQQQAMYLASAEKMPAPYCATEYAISDATPSGESSMNQPSMRNMASERLFMKSTTGFPASPAETMARAKTMVKRMTDRVLPSAAAPTMLVGTMVIRKLETVGFVTAPS